MRRLHPASQGQLPGFEAAPPAAAGSGKTVTRGQGPARYTLFLALFPGPDDACRCAETAQSLRQLHALNSAVLATARLHITLHVIAKNATTLPQAVVDTVRCAMAGVTDWPSVPITFDHALSFLRSQAWVLRCDACSDAAVGRLRQALGLALRRAGLPISPSSTPHMTMLYDARTLDRQPIEALSWTATRLVLVLSHVGCSHHEWMAEWPLNGNR